MFHVSKSSHEGSQQSETRGPVGVVSAGRVRLIMLVCTQQSGLRMGCQWGPAGSRETRQAQLQSVLFTTQNVYLQILQNI